MDGLSRFCTKFDARIIQYICYLGELWEQGKVTASVHSFPSQAGNIKIVTHGIRRTEMADHPSVFDYWRRTRWNGSLKPSNLNYSSRSHLRQLRCIAAQTMREMSDGAVDAPSVEPSATGADPA